MRGAEIKGGREVVMGRRYGRRRLSRGARTVARRREGSGMVLGWGVSMVVVGGGAVREGE